MLLNSPRESWWPFRAGMSFGRQRSFGTKGPRGLELHLSRLSRLRGALILGDPSRGVGGWGGARAGVVGGGGGKGGGEGGGIVQVRRRLHSEQNDLQESEE